MPDRVPCHCLKCRGALVGKSTARQHTAQSRRMGGVPTVQSVPQWLAQTRNAASSSSMGLNEGEEPVAEMDQEDDEEIRPSKRTRVDKEQRVLLVS